MPHARDQENTGSDWLGKMTSLFNPSRKSVNLNYNRHSSKNIIDFAIYNHNGKLSCILNLRTCVSAKSAVVI